MGIIHVYDLFFRPKQKILKIKLTLHKWLVGHIRFVQTQRD